MNEAGQELHVPILLGQEFFDQSEHALIVCGAHELDLDECTAHQPAQAEPAPDQPVADQLATAKSGLDQLETGQLETGQLETGQLMTDAVRLDDSRPDEPITNGIESNEPTTNAAKAETDQPEIAQAEADEAAVEELETETEELETETEELETETEELETETEELETETDEFDAETDEFETETDEPALDEPGARDQWRLEPTSDEQDFDDDQPDDDQPDDDVEDSWRRDEELLDRLREWLAEARRHSEEVDVLTGESDETQSSAAESQFGLYRLVEEFTALRHELKLQTKSARGLEAESQSQLAALRSAIEAFRSVEPNEALAAWSAGKGLATALADLDEALDRGRTQIERAGRILIDEPTRALPVALDELYARQSWFKRLVWKSYHRQARELAASHGRKEREALFAALLEGYGLIQGRLTRALAAERVERIVTLGRPVDPERMIVVELVEAADKPPGSVVDEVRRGYTWNGRILRCAEVRAARDRPQSVPAGVPASNSNG